MKEATPLPRYQRIEGTVDRILGSHQTTDVKFTEQTTTTHPPVTFDERYPLIPDMHHHTETHTFVNTSREFAMLLEVNGSTLKLVSDDYIAVAIGDEVRAICGVVPGNALLVLDWWNVTRRIHFRIIPKPLEAATPPLIMAFVLTLLGLSCLYTFDRYASEEAAWCGLAAVVLAGLVGLYGWRTADRNKRMNATIDHLCKA